MPRKILLACTLLLTSCGYQDSSLSSLQIAQMPQQSFASDQLLKPLAFLDRQPQMPSAYPFRKPFGSNVGVMLDGYLINAFAPDSGRGPGGFLIYDINEPENPKLVRRIYEPEGITKNFREAHAYGLTDYNGQKLMALHTGKGIEIWDFTTIEEAKPISSLDLEGVNFGDYSSVAWQLWWQHPYLYVASSNQGIFVVDTTDPYQPRLAREAIPTSQLGGFRVGPIFTMGNLLVITSMDVNDGFASFDISDALNPKMLSQVDQLPKYYSSCFDGRYLHFTMRGAKARLHSYDLLDPSRPILVSSDLEIDEQLYCTTQDEYIFLGSQDKVSKVEFSPGKPAKIVAQGGLGVIFPDNGQITALGQLLFVGNDHGSGSALMAHSSSADIEPPKLITSSPKNGQLDVGLDSRIGLAFSDSIQLESLKPSAFQLTDQNGEPVELSASVQIGLVNLAPKKPLAPNMSYLLELKQGGISDYAGNSLRQSIRIRFTTTSSRKASAKVLFDFDQKGKSSLYAPDSMRMESALYLQDGLDIEDENLGKLLEASTTLSFYIKTNQVGGSKAWNSPSILGEDKGLFKKDIFWGWIDEEAKLRFSANNSPGISSLEPINDNKWHHVSMTRDADTGDLELFIDGKLQGTSRGPSGLIVQKLSRLGAIASNSFEGFIDHLEIYDRKLSPSQIKTLSERILPQTSPIPLRWPIQRPLDIILFGSYSEAQINWFLDDQPILASTNTLHIEVAQAAAYRLVAMDQNQNKLISRAIRFYSQPLELRPKSTGSIVTNNTHAYILNPDTPSVSAFEILSAKKLWESKLSDKPTSLSLFEDSLWISVGDSIVELDPKTGENLKNIQLEYGDAPYGVLAFAERLYVTLEGSRKLVTYDFDGKLLASQSLDFSPRGMSIQEDKLCISRFISSDSHGELACFTTRDLEFLSKLIIPADEDTVDGEDRARGLANYLAHPSFSPDGKSIFVPAKKDNIFRGIWKDGRELNHENTIRAVLYAGQTKELKQVYDFNNREGARALAFTPEGDYAFVLLEGSQSIEIIDILKGTSVGSIDDVGHTPQGLSITPNGDYLCVMAYLSRQLSCFELKSMRQAKTLAPKMLYQVSSSNYESLNEKILLGKKIFHNASDPRMSLDGYIACSSCHQDARSDGRVWDFTGRGEGLRSTLDLRASNIYTRLHWSQNFDEFQDFENDIRNAFAGTGFMNDEDFERTKLPLASPKSGYSYELDALASYLRSLEKTSRSPFRTSNGQLNALALAGRDLFDSYECGACHLQAGTFSDNKRHDLGTIKASSGLGSYSPLEGVGVRTPSLRALWQNTRYLHDGSASDVAEAISAHQKIENTDHLDALSEYVLSIE